MGLITFENEFSVAVPPAKLFKVYCLETDTLIPKILPQSIKSSEIIEGNGGPGTIRKVTFVEGKSLILSSLSYLLTSKYYIKDGAEIKEDQIKKDGKKTEGLFKAVEAYFLANPDA
ncbi:hypothetical protein D5086_017328 [Populus alba]|uniref:Uncharacterized protein n=2 Tax=Populus alba TaxID=43335 RepID=A0ACC4BY99_POPAL